jgi:hypothetical protein
MCALAVLEKRGHRKRGYWDVRLNTKACRRWYVATTTISTSPASLLAIQSFRISGEYLLTDPEFQLRAAGRWPRIPADDDGIGADDAPGVLAVLHALDLKPVRQNLSFPEHPHLSSRMPGQEVGNAFR